MSNTAKIACSWYVSLIMFYLWFLIDLICGNLLVLSIDIFEIRPKQECLATLEVELEFLDMGQPCLLHSGDSVLFRVIFSLRICKSLITLLMSRLHESFCNIVNSSVVLVAAGQCPVS